MRENRTWSVLEDDTCTHVVPTTDIRPHAYVVEGQNEVELATHDCPCNPKIQVDKRGLPLIIHNSFEDAIKVSDSMKELLNSTKDNEHK